MEPKKIRITCLHCGSVVFRYKNKQRPQEYCSRICYLHSEKNRISSKKMMVDMGLKGAKNPRWKGSEISYKGIHAWISLNFGPAKNYVCEFCNGQSGSKKMNWANMDKAYTRNRDSWKPLCKKCHSQYDQKNFGTYNHVKSEETKKKISLSKIGKKVNVGMNNPMYGVAPWNKGLKKSNYHKTSINASSKSEKPQ